MAKVRKSYPSDVGDDEWAFCAPYLTLMKEDAPQREHSLRELYNALRWFLRAGCPWRMMPNDLPPWHAVQQQAQRWLRAGCFQTMAGDLRALLRLAARRDSVPSAVILDSRTLQSTPESGGRAGFDGHKKRKGSKVHAAVDTLGHSGGDGGQRPGPGAGGGPGPSGASGHGGERAIGLCGSRVHWRAARGGGG